MAVGLAACVDSASASSKSLGTDYNIISLLSSSFSIPFPTMMVGWGSRLKKQASLPRKINSHPKNSYKLLKFQLRLSLLSLFGF